MSVSYNYRIFVSRMWYYTYVCSINGRGYTKSDTEQFCDFLFIAIYFVSIGGSTVLVYKDRYDESFEKRKYHGVCYDCYISWLWNRSKFIGLFAEYNCIFE